MATQVQWRGGSTTEHNAFTGAAREVTVDTTKTTLVVHDGSTAGGEPLLREDQNNLPSSVTNGLYKPGTNQVALATGGTGKLFIDANGNVGVGRTPSYPLDVNTGTGVRVRFGDGTNNVEIYGADGRVSTGVDLKLQAFNSNITFGAGGSASEKMRITSDGKVGVGDTNPSHKLDVKETNNTTYSAGNFILNPTARLHNASTTAASFSSLAFRTASADNAIGFIYTGTTNQADFVIVNDGGVNGNERFRITSDGKVGIGTTTVDALFHVSEPSDANLDVLLAARGGNGRSSEVRFLTKNSSGANTGGAVGFDASAGLCLTASSTSIDSAKNVVIDSAGRLLVGTTSTTSNAGVVIQGASGASDGILRLASDNATPADGESLGILAFSANNHSNSARIVTRRDGGTWTAGTSEPTRLEFYTTADGASSPDPRMTISSAGEILINRITRDGDVGSNCKLQVLCTGGEWATVIRNSNSSPYGLRITTDTDANNTSNLLLGCYGAGNQRAAIRSNGGLANYQSNNVDLSDERTKRDIAPALSTWNCVQAWEVVNYNYIDDAADDASRVGVIAQQVQQHCPEVVIPYQEAEDAVLDEDGNVLTPAKEERLGVREQQMMWMAIKALQEAQVRIEALEAEVAALKAR